MPNRISPLGSRYSLHTDGLPQGFPLQLQMFSLTQFLSYSLFTGGKVKTEHGGGLMRSLSFFIPLANGTSVCGNNILYRIAVKQYLSINPHVQSIGLKSKSRTGSIFICPRESFSPPVGLVKHFLFRIESLWLLFPASLWSGRPLIQFVGCCSTSSELN